VGIEKVNARITDIQSRILALQTQQAAPSTPAQSATAQAGGDSFAGYLQDAVSVAPVAAAGRTYSLNSQGIPTDLAAYGNGRIPAGALEQVGATGYRLWAPAAQGLTALINDARKDGVHIGINESYRPYTEQVELARTKGLYSQGGLAAKPGTSEHGWGMAADLDLDSKALAWMRQNGARYGYVNSVSRESWHWAYRPNAR